MNKQKIRQMIDFEMMVFEFLESALAVKWSTFEIETDKTTQIVEKQDLLCCREHFGMQKSPVVPLKKR